MKVKILSIVFICFITTLFAPQAFAANIHVVGTVVDEKNVPVPVSQLIFTDEQSHKEMAMVMANFSGAYLVIIPAGTYTVTIIPPRNTGLSQVIEQNQKFDANGVHNISFPSSSAVGLPQKQQNWILIAIIAVVVLILLAIVVGYSFLKRKK